MPAALAPKKSFSSKLSKKWNSVIGNGKNNNNKVGNIKFVVPITGSIQLSNDDDEESGDYKTTTATHDSIINNKSSGNSKTTTTKAVAVSTPTQTPESVVISDTSSDEDEEEEEIDYGYGDATPDSENFAVQATDDDVADDVAEAASSLFPKRLSSRMSSNNGEEKENDENLPFHPQRQPRRSSLKGSCPTRRASRISRRASIASCSSGTTNNTNTNTISTRTLTTMKIEEEIAIGELDPKKVVEIQLPGRRESIKRRISITFNEDVNVRKIQPVSKVKGANKEELWFQDQEYSIIKKKTKALIEKVDENGIVNGKKYCTRGLEKYMQDPVERVQGKYDAWDSVLEEQELQRKTNNYHESDENIARLYKYTSTMSIIQATQRATYDAEEVASFYINGADDSGIQAMQQRPLRACRRRASCA